LTNLHTKPGWLRLAACLVYDGLVVLALSFALALGFISLFGDASHGLKRCALQLFLWLGNGLYFVWCWRKSGQTLAMQTWQLRLSYGQVDLLNWPQAFIRYALASLGLGVFGLGFVWAVFDRDGLFLHDRLLNSRITYVSRVAT
jgi:uncharacterized RDD family membrane protein YckC